MIILAMMLLAGWLLLAVVMLALAGGFLFVYKHRRQPLITLLFVIAVVALAAGSLMGVRTSREHHHTIAIPSQVSTQTPIGVTTSGGQAVTVMAEPAGAKDSEPATDPTLEALWDKLTKSRINLDADFEEPAAGPEDEKAKEAVKDTFGLDDKGKMPPKWVITPPKQIGQVYRASVASDPWATEEECRQQLVENVLPQKVARRIEYLAPSRVNRKVSVADPLLLGIGPDYILREICRDEFTGTVDSSVGEMKKVHVLLEFDENIDNYLVDAWLRHERQIRFASVSRVAALSLTGLAAIYGLLRFDTWSKGYYSGRLLVGGTLAIIALVVFVLKT